MHAYLIEGEGETLEKAIQTLVKDLKAKLFILKTSKSHRQIFILFSRRLRIIKCCRL